MVGATPMLQDVSLKANEKPRRMAPDGPPPFRDDARSADLACTGNAPCGADSAAFLVSKFLAPVGLGVAST